MQGLGHSVFSERYPNCHKESIGIFEKNKSKKGKGPPFRAAPESDCSQLK